MTFYRTTRLMLSSAAILSFASSAFALDGVDLLKKINAAYVVPGGSLAADGVDVDGSSVTLKGASIKPVTGTAAPVVLGNVLLTGVVEDAKGGYTIDKVAFPDVSSTKDGVTITVADISVGGVTVPATPGVGGLDGMLLTQKAHAGPIRIVKDGVEVLSISELQTNLTKRADGSGIDADSGLNGLKADLSKVGDPASQNTINKLALQHVTGNITTKGSWTLQAGTIDIKDFAIDLDNVGRLDIALGISGYTLDFMKAMQDALKASQTNPNKEQAQQATGLAMLGLMQQLTLDNASITFKDASITKRALDYAGASQGVSGAQMASTLKGLTPIMLAQLNIPELQTSVSAAVNSFLDDPKNFTLTASPAKPVPFPMIVGAAMGAPNTIPSVIGLKVTAND